MNTPRMVSLFVFLLAGMAIFGQAGFVKAHAQGGTPLTSPLTYYISGTVMYKYARWFTPAQGVTVEAKPLDNNNRFTILTNDKGTYSLPVPEGTYDVKAYDRFFTIFTPFSRRVEVHNNVAGINFIGVRKAIQRLREIYEQKR